MIPYFKKLIVIDLLNNNIFKSQNKYNFECARPQSATLQIADVTRKNIDCHDTFGPLH